ncbi:MAG: hypothetical protein F6J92_33480 [Symploca sp. SIO1A3]|nr:hypothetical protein [Symploca sp. SIO1A3]
MNKFSNYSVLILRTERTHDDLELVVSELKIRGIQVFIFNVQLVAEGGLSFTDFINSYIWEEIDIIDVRYCRGIARNWLSTYKRIFDELQDFLQIQETRGNVITVTPSFATLHWVLYKAGYIKELQEQKISMIPTMIISPPPDGHSEFDIVDYLNQAGSEGIVLKPAVGSGANKLEFIRKVIDSEYQYQVKSYYLDNHQEKQIINFIKNYQELNSHFQDYCNQINIPILVQHFEKITSEISMVFVGEIPHCIERTTAPNMGIAHERFGGENILIINPSNKWLTFAQEVYQALPEVAKKTISLRIDMFERLDGKLVLSEIEGASHRTFFPEVLQFCKEHPLAEKRRIEQLDLNKIRALKKYVELLCSFKLS